MPGGRPPGPNVLGKPRNSGRKRGSLDLSERKVLTGQMAADILQVYQRLGGVKWLEKFAREQPAEFLRQGLSRLFPAADKHDDSVVLNQLNIGGDMSTLESASRIAFALAKAGQQLDKGELIEAVGPEPLVQTPDPVAAPDPVARDSAWASLLPPSAEEKQAQAAARPEKTLDSHHGSNAEQAEPKQPRPGLPNRRDALL